MHPGESKITITLNGEEIGISKEMKGAWYKMINDVRRLAYKTCSCSQTDFRQCCGDCQLCHWSRPGILVPLHEDLDGFGYDGNVLRTKLTPANDEPGPADIVESADTVERLLKHARSVCKDGNLILAMTAEKLSSYEIAHRLGLSQTAICHRLKKIRAAVKAYYIENFM